MSGCWPRHPRGSSRAGAEVPSKAFAPSAPAGIFKTPGGQALPRRRSQIQREGAREIAQYSKRLPGKHKGL